MQNRPLQFVTAGFGYGQAHPGVELGPSAWLRFFMQHYPQLLSQAPVTELISKKFEYKPIRNQADIGRFPWSYYDQLSEQVEISQSYDLLPVVLGGDHSLGLASVQASLNQYDNLKLLWIDAHADMNTPESSPTGSVHGMPLSHLLGLWGDTDRALLAAKNLVLLGVRDLDPGEKKLITELKIKVFSMDDIRSQGMKACTQQALAYLKAKNSPVHISFDVDSLDPTLFPSTGVPVAGGINAIELTTLFSQLLTIPNIAALDLVEYNPTLNGQASLQGLHMIGEFLVQLKRRHLQRFSNAQFNNALHA